MASIWGWKYPRFSWLFLNPCMLLLAHKKADELSGGILPSLLSINPWHNIISVTTCTVMSNPTYTPLTYLTTGIPSFILAILF
jgi:hypothetical protein